MRLYEEKWNSCEELRVDVDDRDPIALVLGKVLRKIANSFNYIYKIPVKNFELFDCLYLLE